MLEKMKANDAELREIADEFDRLLASPVAPDAERLADVRWRLSRQMVQQIALKERYLYVPIERHKDPEIAAIGKRFKDDLTAKFGPFQKHMQSWTPDRIESDWETYRVSAMELTQVMRSRIDAEARELYPIIATLDDPKQSVERNWAHEAWDIRENIRPKSASN